MPKKRDYVEVERKGNRIILTPKLLLDREKAKAELFKLIDRIRKRNEDLKPEEVEEIVTKALEEVRAKRRRDRYGYRKGSHQPAGYDP